MSLQDPTKNSYYVVRLTQDGADYIYTDWTAPLGLSETLVPSMEIGLPPNSGTLDEKPVTIKFPAGIDSFLDALADGRPQAAVYLTLVEVSVPVGPIDNGTEEVPLGRYRLVRAFRNPEAQAGLIRLEFLSAKGRLNIALGIPAYPACAWTFGDKSCQATPATMQATIAGVDRKRIVFTDPDAAVLAGDWHRGTVSFGGLSLGIRSWDGYEFELIREPPPAWNGALVTLREGCAKSLEACEAKDNVEHFGGIGLKIPAFHPIMESP